MNIYLVFMNTLEYVEPNVCIVSTNAYSKTPNLVNNKQSNCYRSTRIRMPMCMPTPGAQLKVDVLLYKECVYALAVVASSWTFNVSSWTSATSSSWTIFTSASSSPIGGE